MPRRPRAPRGRLALRAEHAPFAASFDDGPRALDEVAGLASATARRGARCFAERFTMADAAAAFRRALVEKVAERAQGATVRPAARWVAGLPRSGTNYVAAVVGGALTGGTRTAAPLPPRAPQRGRARCMHRVPPRGRDRPLRVGRTRGRRRRRDAHGVHRAVRPERHRGRPGVSRRLFRTAGDASNG